MSLKAAFNDKLTWDQFLREVEKKESIYLHQLKNEGESRLLYRAQGALEALKRIKELREALNARE